MQPRSSRTAAIDRKRRPCCLDHYVENRDIQRLAAASITAELFKDLAAHGEDLLVERKGAIPSAEKLGAEVASMANMLGGWVLLGVNDTTRKLESLDLAQGVDMQSHIGNLLRNAVDPVPPFLADTIEVEGLTVGFVRVFSSSVVVLVSGSGAVYTRDAGGKLPVSDHRALLDLADRGREAEEEAIRRASENRLSEDVPARPTVSSLLTLKPATSQILAAQIGVESSVAMNNAMSSAPKPSRRAGLLRLNRRGRCPGGPAQRPAGEG